MNTNLRKQQSNNVCPMESNLCTLTNSYDSLVDKQTEIKSVFCLLTHVFVETFSLINNVFMCFHFFEFILLEAIAKMLGIWILLNYNHRVIRKNNNRFGSVFTKNKFQMQICNKIWEIGRSVLKI